MENRKLIAIFILIFAFLGLVLVFYGAFKNNLGISALGLILSFVGLGISFWLKKSISTLKAAKSK